MEHLNIHIEALPCRTANIIKQEMLSVGGDAAVSRDSVACAEDVTEVVIMGTVKQLRKFSEKILNQAFGLHTLAETIEEALNNISRKSHELKMSHRKIMVGDRPLLMGIINVTPDSFSDGGQFSSLDDAYRFGCGLVEDGADILDIGGESSRPGAEPVSVQEELRRVIPVVEKIAGAVSVPISVDTCKAEVARQALQSGAEIVNDISAMRYDPGMADVIAQAKAAVVIMHMRGTPRTMQQGELSYGSLRGEILSFLTERCEAATSSGIANEYLIVDPGIGFGKTAEDNLRIIKYLSEFKVLGRPILIGPSRKAFIATITGGPPSKREEGTASAIAAAVLNGANILRVHHVLKMKKVAAMANAILRA
jgi:dihydropteroate synthase